MKDRGEEQDLEAQKELKKEFFVLLVVYAFLSILPVLTGFACQS